MQLNQFQFLLALEKYGTFSNAAIGLSVPQSSISTSIRSMEKELNCQLLIRSKSGVEFTPMGEIVLSAARTIEEACNNIKLIADENTKFNRPFRVGAVQYLCNSVIMHSVFNMKNENPDTQVSVEIIPDNTTNLLNALTNGNIDYALIVSRDFNQKEIKNAMAAGVIFKEIFTQRVVFSVRKDHPLLAQSPVPVSEIMKYPFVTYFQPIDPILDDLFTKHNHSSPITFINDIFNARRHIASTDAVIFSDEFAVLNGNNIFTDKLYIVETTDVHERSTVYLAQLANHKTSIDDSFLKHITNACNAVYYPHGGEDK